MALWDAVWMVRSRSRSLFFGERSTEVMVMALSYSIKHRYRKIWRDIMITLLGFVNFPSDTYTIT